MYEIDLKNVRESAKSSANLLTFFTTLSLTNTRANTRHGGKEESRAGFKEESDVRQEILRTIRDEEKSRRRGLFLFL